MCDILTMIEYMLCYSMSSRGYKGVRESKFSKCSNWAQTLLKVCMWHSNHDKTYAMLYMSLRGHKGFRKSKFSKCSNWAETWLKWYMWHDMIKHILCYKMSLRCHKGVKGQVHKDIPIGLKINGMIPTTFWKC